jgi:hypothetical protein
MLSFYVNYFDIGELQGVGHGSTHDRENVRHDPMLIPFPLR